MTDDSRHTFDPEHLRRWWEATCYYLFADMESLPGAAAADKDGWLPPQTDSHGGRKRFIARARGQLLRSVRHGEQGDSLRQLENAYQRQITFIARHPDVPRRLLSWLTQDDDRGLQRRVRRLIGHYACRLARIIARAKQQGLVRANIEPHAAALSLVGVIQGLVLRADAAPQRREWFLMESVEAFARYRAGLTFHS